MCINQPDRPYSQPGPGETQLGHPAERKAQHQDCGEKRVSQGPHKARIVSCPPLLPLAGLPPMLSGLFLLQLSSSPSVKAASHPRIVIYN